MSDETALNMKHNLELTNGELGELEAALSHCFYDSEYRVALCNDEFDALDSVRRKSRVLIYRAKEKAYWLGFKKSVKSVDSKGTIGAALDRVFSSPKQVESTDSTKKESEDD